MNHEDGQYRAELFERLMFRLLYKMHTGAGIHQNVVFTYHSPEGKRSVGIDFVVEATEGDIIVETKAPYAKGAADAVNRTLRRLLKSLDVVIFESQPPQLIVLALAIPLPPSSTRLQHELATAVAAKGCHFEVWDGAHVLKLVREQFGIMLTDLSVVELSRFLTETLDPSIVQLHEPQEPPSLPRGEQTDVVILVADFCSFSRFVHASASDLQLITSVMSRFYRETRRVILEEGGVLDKFMGDGILAYWFGREVASRLQACVERLIGIALNLAEEWQDQLDLSVEPKGLRVGAAIGNVLFIPEVSGAGPVHAIGDSINIAARLQAKAAPNALLISNRLHSRHFAASEDFVEIGPLELKNIGHVIAWSKDFPRATGA